MLDGTKEWSLAAHKLELQVGEQHLIELEGLGSAGYTWTFQLEGDASVANIVKRTNAPMPSPLTPETFSVQESFVIIAKVPGRVMVKFAQRRLWEDNDIPPRAEKVFEVFVKVSDHDESCK